MICDGWQARGIYPSEPDVRWGYPTETAILGPMARPKPLVLPHQRPPTIGELIRYTREQLSLSQDDLGEIVGVTGQTIGRYEAGRDVKPTRLKQIAEAMGKQLRDFLPDDDVDPDEQRLTAWFREARPHQRRAVLTYIQTLQELSLHEREEAIVAPRPATRR